MARFLCVASLALAAVSAVSSHVIRHSHRGVPVGWQAEILQDYDVYHQRYLDWCCHDEKANQTEKWNTCCHPLLKSQDPHYLEQKSPLCGRPANGCKARDDECEDDDGSKVSPSPQNLSNPPQGGSPPAHNKTTEAGEPPKDASPPKTTDSQPPSNPEHSTTTSSSTTSTSPSPTPTQSSGGGGGGGRKTFTGIATFFWQKGNAGSCGQVHHDDDFIIALHPAMDPKAHCGQSVKITNVNDRTKSVTAVCADTCPTCTDATDIDLSHALFNAVVGDDGLGVGTVEWSFV